MILDFYRGLDVVRFLGNCLNSNFWKIATNVAFPRVRCFRVIALHNYEDTAIGLSCFVKAEQMPGLF